ncbi:Acyl- N-acyltransferase [Fusarium acutatum]|uniref:Acyl- N-acyltransferase n=1 Tax=Fusarium acutatum TaxID=78861 RepID=A0A8H4K7W8_9HYPO|nr:Acyl- N-acyltransferase [Fusarium acutatum]
MRSVLGELRTVINAAYKSHGINSLGEIGQRIQYDTQIADEIVASGFTVVMFCMDEIVGTASVKDWKASAQDNDWKPAGYYDGVSAEEAAVMETGTSTPEGVANDGDVEAFMVAVKPGLEYRKKGIAEGLMRACEQQLKQRAGGETNQVRIILQVVKELNRQYWLKKGHHIVGERYCPPSTWEVERAFIVLIMRKDI